MNDQRVDPKQLYDIPDAARALGEISQWTLRRHVTLGTVSVIRLGRRVFLRGEEIERIRQEGLPSLPVAPAPKAQPEGETQGGGQAPTEP